MNRCSYVDDISGTAALEAVPFLLAAGALPDLPDGNSLQELFVRLREKCDLEPNHAYNMILYHHHMIVIPRRTANIDGIDANAAGMTGDVWCSSEAQFEEWGVVAGLWSSKSIAGTLAAKSI
jgi:hypothetical protein